MRARHLIDAILTLRVIHPAEYLRCGWLAWRMAWRMYRRLTLSRNMEKGGWSNMENAALLRHAQQEISEAQRVNGQGGLASRLWDEAADAANLLAMAADNGPNGTWEADD